MANLCVRFKFYASSDFMWLKYIVSFVRTRARVIRIWITEVFRRELCYVN